MEVMEAGRMLVVFERSGSGLDWVACRGWVEAEVCAWAHFCAGRLEVLKDGGRNALGASEGMVSESVRSMGVSVVNVLEDDCADNREQVLPAFPPLAVPSLLLLRSLHALQQCRSSVLRMML